MPTPETSPPEPRLRERLRLERYVFFAFSAVIAMIALAGVIEFKRQQAQLLDRCAELADAQAATATQERRLVVEREEHRKRLEASRLELDQAQSRERAQGREAGLALTRLAFADAAGDEAARLRARALLDDAMRAGAPPFIPLARWVLADLRVPALEYSSRPTGQPVECAAASPDGEAFALARADRSIEIIKTSTGRLLRRIEPAHPADNILNLVLGDDLRLFSGWRQGALVHHRLTPQGELAATHTVGYLRQSVRALGLSPSGTRIAAADTGGLIQVYDAEPPHALRLNAPLGSPALAVCALDGPDFLAAAICADGKFMLLKGERGDRVELHPFEAAPDYACVGSRGGRLIAACVYGEKLERVIATGGKVATKGVVGHGLGGIGHLAVSADGSVLAAGRSGLVARILEDGRVERLPVDFGRPVKLAVVCRLGYLLAASGGQVTLSPDLGLLRRGMRVAGRGETTRAEATPLGFAITQADSETSVWPAGLRYWIETGRHDRVLPLYQSWAASSGFNGMDPGGRPRLEAGVLAGVVRAPAAAIFAGNDGVLRVADESGAGLTLASPVPGLPDAATTSSGPGDLLLLRYDRRLVLVRTASGRIRELEGEVIAGPMALCATGTRAAFCTAQGVQVVYVEGDGAPKMFAIRNPRALGLMFSGSVLVCLAGGELTFYEVESGRRLYSMRTDATGLAACDDELLLVAPDEVRVLALRD